MSNEIDIRNDGALVRERSGIIPADNETVKVLRVSRDDRGPDFKRMLAAALQLFSAADLIGKIEKGAEFVVQVPAQYQADLRSGALEMMHSAKSGKTWATLVRKLPDGRQKIVCNCSITEQMRVQGSAIQDLAGVYQNMALQHQLAELSEQVAAIYDTVRRIEQGQMDDRIGKLLSGRNDALQALKNPNMEDRKRELELARSKISEAQQQIGQAFKSRVEGFKRIPENRFQRLFCEIKSPTTHYMKRQDEEFGKLQEYFEFYLRATQLLAWTYSVVGDTTRAESTFEQGVTFLRSINFGNVRTLDHIYPRKSMADAFYHRSIPYMRAEKAACLEEARPYEYVQLTVSSEELLEVMQNGKAL